MILLYWLTLIGLVWLGLYRVSLIYFFFNIINIQSLDELYILFASPRYLLSGLKGLPLLGHFLFSPSIFEILYNVYTKWRDKCWVVWVYCDFCHFHLFNPLPMSHTTNTNRLPSMPATELDESHRPSPCSSLKIGGGSWCLANGHQHCTAVILYSRDPFRRHPSLRHERLDTVTIGPNTTDSDNCSRRIVAGDLIVFQPLPLGPNSGWPKLLSRLLTVSLDS